MMLHSMFLVMFLFGNVEGEDVSQKTIKYQKIIDERFEEVYNLLRDQAIQIKEQRERIGTLENQIYNQNPKYQLEALQDDLKIQTKEIESLKDIVNRQQKEITEVKKRLAVVTSRQIKCARNSMNLMDIISSQWRRQHKDCNDCKLQLHGSSVETTTPNINLFTTGDSLHNGRGKRLLIGQQTTVSPPIRPTAFYAYFNAGENGISTHHTLIFDVVKTSYNGGYSPFTGVFTVPVSGVYGFTYTIRMTCSRTSSFGAFELVRNSEVEGVILFTETGCSQGTRSTTVIIHANSGDMVLIRSHMYLGIDGNIISDANGRTSFAGWLIFSDQ